MCALNIGVRIILKLIIEIGWGMDWTHLAQDRDQYGAEMCCEQDKKPSGSITCWEILQ
jgi:hypothetical protein